MDEQQDFNMDVILKADIEISTEWRSALSYTLFYGSILDLDTELIKSLYEYQHALDKSAIFIPRIKTFECTICPEPTREEFCLGNGLYCFNPPSDEVMNKYPEVKAVDILDENLRERCIYELVRDKRN